MVDEREEMSVGGAERKKEKPTKMMIGGSGSEENQLGFCGIKLNQMKTEGHVKANEINC